MQMMFKNVIERMKFTPAYGAYRLFQQRKAYKEWERNGKPAPPPPLVKHRIIKNYALTFSLDTLIETGTYLGETVLAVKDVFDNIFSIELDETLAGRAQKKFSKYRHITILQGDSGEIIKDILSGIKKPCLFWLDSHYSGGLTTKGEYDTPILQELSHIFNHQIKDHVLLIDDARHFAGEKDYPTLQELQDFALKNRPGWSFSVRYDIIRFHKNADLTVSDVDSI